MTLTEARKQISESTGEKDLTKIDQAILDAGRAAYQAQAVCCGKAQVVALPHERYVNFTAGRAHGNIVELPQTTICDVINHAIAALKTP